MEIGPESKKFLEAKEASEYIGAFMEWFEQQGYVMGKYDKYDRLYPIYDGINKLLYQYFDIDEKKLDQERKDILKAYQEANNQGDSR
jgi:hypothetical protein